MADENSLGFAGLGTLITAPGTIEAELTRIAARSPLSSPAAVLAKPAPAANAPTEPNRSAQSGGAYVWWGTGVIGAILIWGLASIPPPPEAVAIPPTRSPDVATPSVDVTAERQPAVAVNAVLGDSEIRYCVFQGKRLEAASTVVDKYSKAQVGRYNSLVNDYNGRCSSFRYRDGALERIRREAETKNGQLRLEGANLLTGYR